MSSRKYASTTVMSTSPRVALHRSPPFGGGDDAEAADDGGVSGWSGQPCPSPKTPDDTRFNSCTVVGRRFAKDPLRPCPERGVPFEPPPRHALGRRSRVAINTHALHNSALSTSPGVDASSPSSLGFDDDASRTMSALFPTKSAGTGSPQKPCTTQPSRASPRSLPPTAATMASRASVSEPAGVADANEARAAISLAQRARRPRVLLRVRSCTNTTPSRLA
mmetsp:Transcript_5292/g.21650  ORF Transcript_5292/g.21650 Transcript_5292/m.21650 type:complete len:221 (+) Transcript_5292:63-725(+)